MNELIQKLLATIVDHITAEVESKIRDKVKEMVDDRLEAYDPTDHHGFEQSVENIVENMNLSDIVKEVINDGSFSVEFRT